MSNTFVWNITCTEPIQETDTYEFDIIPAWEKTYFVMWEIDISSSEEVLEYFKKEFWEIEFHDISISTEDELEIWGQDYEQWVYEVVSFQGPEVDMEGICKRFEGTQEVISIRQAEPSERFWNRVIKVDFLY